MRGVSRGGIRSGTPATCTGACSGGRGDADGRLAVRRRAGGGRGDRVGPAGAADAHGRGGQPAGAGGGLAAQVDGEGEQQPVDGGVHEQHPRHAEQAGDEGGRGQRDQAEQQPLAAAQRGGAGRGRRGGRRCGRRRGRRPGAGARAAGSSSSSARSRAAGAGRLDPDGRRLGPLRLDLVLVVGAHRATAPGQHAHGDGEPVDPAELLLTSCERSAIGTRTASQARTMTRRIRPLPTAPDGSDHGTLRGDAAPGAPGNFSPRGTAAGRRRGRPRRAARTAGGRASPRR